MWLELCPCLSIMNKLKLNAFAAMFTALSGNTSVPGNDVHSHIYFKKCDVHHLSNEQVIKEYFHTVTQS